MGKKGRQHKPQRRLRSTSRSDKEAVQKDEEEQEQVQAQAPQAQEQEENEGEAGEEEAGEEVDEAGHEQDEVDASPVNCVSSCAHISKSVKVEQIEEALGSHGPPYGCSGCNKDGKKHRSAGSSRKKSANRKKSSSQDASALWVCLACAHFGCGAAEGDKLLGHSAEHSRRARHHLVLNSDSGCAIWCFECKRFILKGCRAADGFGTTPKAQLLQQAVKAVQDHPSRVREATAKSSARDQQRAENGCVRGLINLGNTCFFNSVMQNLLALTRLQRHFLEPPVFSEGPLTSALRSFFQEVNTGGTLEQEGVASITKGRLREQGSINPKGLFAAICARSPRFKGFQQQDSHELLRCLLDGLQVEEETRRGEEADKVRTFVEHLFGGEFASTVTCCDCGHSSSVSEAFLDLSLPIPSAAKAGKQGKKKEKKKTEWKKRQPRVGSPKVEDTEDKHSVAGDDGELGVGADYVNVEGDCGSASGCFATASGVSEASQASSDAVILLPYWEDQQAGCQSEWEMVQEEVMESLGDLFDREEEAVTSCGTVEGPAAREEGEEEEAEAEEETMVEECISPMTLRGCLSAFTKSEVLCGENAWVCERCSSAPSPSQSGAEAAPASGGDEEEACSKLELVRREATKSLIIRQAPPVLTIHLKRFAQDIRGRLSKLTGHVSFDELLSLNQFQHRGYEPSLYHLVGVVEHLGTMRGGHYVAYVRGSTGDCDEKKWYHISDSHVRKATLDEVLRSEAYLLFYERASSGALP